MRNIDDLVQKATMFLGYRPRRKDEILERAIRRIQDLYTKDHLTAAAIAKLLGSDYPDSSPMRREDFIQFVIDRT